MKNHVNKFGPRATIKELISVLGSYPEDYEIEINGDTEFSVSSEKDYDGVQINTKRHIGMYDEGRCIDDDEDEDDDGEDMEDIYD